MFPSAQSGGQSCLISLSVIWMRGLSATSESLQTTASCQESQSSAKVEICKECQGQQEDLLPNINRKRLSKESVGVLLNGAGNFG